MRPIDDFTFLKGNRIDLPNTSLMRLYYPIIGAEAFTLYHYLVSFWDDGQHKHKYSEILNHLMIGMPAFENAMAILTAMDLVALYQQTNSYTICLKPPMDTATFLNTAVYRQLLTQKIGEIAVEELMLTFPQDAKNISKSFSDVFDNQGQAKSFLPQSTNDVQRFDMDSFKNLMKRDGLSFSKDKSDIIALYRLAEKYHMSWYDTFLLAKETAVDLTISLDRMKAKKKQQTKQVTSDELTPQEQVIVKEAQTDKPTIFLAKLKKWRKATTTSDEYALLSRMAKMGLLDEVINVIILYTIMRTNSANVNAKYAIKIANDFSYQGVIKAQDALLKMRQTKYKPTTRSNKASSKSTKTNIPDWSDPNYQNKTSEADQAKLEATKQEMLKKLRKDR